MKALRASFAVLFVLSAAGLGWAWWTGAVDASPLRAAAAGLVALFSAASLVGAVCARCAPNIALTGLAVMIPLAAIDQYFGRPSMLNPRINAAAELGVDFDPRWAADAALDESAAGRKTYPSLTPPNFAVQRLTVDGVPVLPFGNIADSRIALCNEAGEYRYVRTDRHGFVNDSGIWDRPQVKAVLVGDSFAEGWCVQQNESFAALLNDRLGGVLNLGRGGMGAAAEAAVLREYAPGRRADWLIWTVFEGNDWDDARAEQGDDILARYADRGYSQLLFDRRDAVQAAMAAYADDYLDAYAWKRRIPFGKWRAVYGTAQIAALFQRKQPPAAVVSATGRGEAVEDGVDWEFVGAAFRRGFDAAAAIGARPVVVLLPSFDAFPQPNSVASARRAALRRMVEDFGGIYVDGDAAFRAAIDDPRDFFPLRMWGHYDRRGHEVIAQAVAAALEGR